MVLLVDDQCQRGDWRCGVVVETDGGELVRSVSVKTAAGRIFSRDRTRVVRLELDPMRAEE